MLGKPRGACEHREEVTTENFGLVRRLCLQCGLVRIEAGEEVAGGALFQAVPT